MPVKCPKTAHLHCMSFLAVCTLSRWLLILSKPLSGHLLPLYSGSSLAPEPVTHRKHAAKFSRDQLTEWPGDTAQVSLVAGKIAMPSSLGSAKKAAESERGTGEGLCGQEHLPSLIPIWT